jgi:hypothetical protein
LLPIVTPVRVVIVGAPARRGAEVKDTWREFSEWAAGRLRRRERLAYFRLRPEPLELLRGSLAVPAGAAAG